MTAGLPSLSDSEAAPAGPAVSDRSRGVALTLAFALGVFGAHRFYVGRPESGVLMLVSVGGLGLWWLYDLILIAAGEFRDGERRIVSRWSRFELRGEGLMPRGPSAELADQVDALRREVSELAERVDFHERLLSQYKERGRLPTSPPSPGPP